MKRSSLSLTMFGGSNRGPPADPRFFNGHGPAAGGQFGGQLPPGGRRQYEGGAQAYGAPPGPVYGQGGPPHGPGQHFHQESSGAVNYGGHSNPMAGGQDYGGGNFSHRPAFDSRAQGPLAVDTGRQPQTDSGASFYTGDRRSSADYSSIHSGDYEAFSPKRDGFRRRQFSTLDPGAKEEVLEKQRKQREQRAALEQQMEEKRRRKEREKEENARLDRQDEMRARNAFPDRGAARQPTAHVVNKE